MIVIPEHGLVAVVDDDDIDRLIISRVLGLSDLKNAVCEFPSATSFIERLEEPADDDLGISLVLMDINMPGMTGLEALEHIRTVSGREELPIVVMLTSSEAKSDIEKAEALGAHGYIVKQSGLADFVAAINANFSNQEVTEA